MKTSNEVRRNQAGFTLIEIIAVLVILGILAAVAVPRFVDMQSEARNKAVEGAIAAGVSQLTMNLSEHLLTSGGNTESWTGDVKGVALGDFTATLSRTCTAPANVQITGGPSWFGSVAAASKFKTYNVCN